MKQRGIFATLDDIFVSVDETKYIIRERSRVIE